MKQQIVRFLTLLSIATLLPGCRAGGPVNHIEIPDTVEVVMDGFTRYNQLQATGEGACKTFSLQVNAPWTLSCEDEWLTISPSIGEAGKEYTVTLSATDNLSRSSRQTTIILSVDKGDGWTKDYTLIQRGPEGVDAHPDGYLFFDEDFDWIKDGWTSTEKYGLPEYTVEDRTNALPISSIVGAQARMSESFVSYDASKTFGRYDGYVVAGTQTESWLLASKFLGEVDNDCTTSIDLSFDAAVYTSKDGSKDNGILKVSILSDGEFVDASDAVKSISDDKKTVTLDLSGEDIFVWNTHHVIFKGVSNSSQFAFGGDAACRIALDNVKALRCPDDCTKAPATSIQKIDTDYDFSLNLEDNAPGIPDIYNLTVRANKAWTIESDSPWMTITKVANASGDAVCARISDDGLSASAPSSGTEYSGTLISLSLNDSAVRAGKLSMKVDGQIVKTISVVQDKAATAEGEIARWTFTGLYYKTYSGIAPVPESGGYKIAESWCTKHYAESDVVKGGTISAYTKNAGATYTIAGTNRPCNALRFGLGSKGDYFLFSVKLVMVEAGSVIQFRNAGLAVTSLTASPCEWVEEYSLDGGETWKTLKEITLTEGHYVIGKETEMHKLDCDIAVTETIIKATLLIRVRITSNKTGTTTFTDGSADIAYIYSDPNIKVNSSDRSVQTATYTDERDYLIFNVKK